MLATTGEIGGDRHYTGAGLGTITGWTCPACRVENVSVFEQGCPSCGAGAPGYHVGEPPPPIPVAHTQRLADTLKLQTPAFAAVKRDLDQGREVYQAALQWAAAHEEASRADAFVAGYTLARQQLQAQVMHAQPVTVDVAQLAPAGKARRTIVAALKLFRDQVLSQSPDEIESGEWCGVEETEAVIAQLEGEG